MNTESNRKQVDSALPSQTSDFDPRDEVVENLSPDWWTGIRPNHGECPGVDQNGKIHSLPQLRLDNCTRADMLSYFQNSWAITEVLFTGLVSADAFLRAPAHQLRHPLIFYYGHPAVLYVNKLRVAGLLKDSVDTYFEQVFETGVDEMSWDDMSKNEMNWPSIASVTEYRRRVYKLVVELIQNHPALGEDRLPFRQNSPAWAMAMAFEHERIHIETTTVLMRELPVELLRRPIQWPANGFGIPPNSQSTAPPLAMRAVSAGAVFLGKSTEFASFGWDNEYGAQTVSVPSFEVSQTLVSNAEYLEFVKDGGYREEKFWSKEGWRWRQFRNSKWPIFWVPDGPAGLHEFQLRLIFEVVGWQGALPAIVNQHEAKAYAAWKSAQDHSSVPYRLLSEVEHHRLRQLSNQVETPNANSNLGLRFGSETSVFGDTPLHAVNQIATNPIELSPETSLKTGPKTGPETWPDVFGNLWQWTEDEFHPLPGFEVHPYYDDFSAPCFDGKHFQIMGGSFASTGDEASVYARFHFRAHFFQHAGFRLVKPNPVQPKTSFHFKDQGKNASDYESDELLSQYLLLHFGKTEISGPNSLKTSGALNFPQRCAQVATEFAKREKVPMTRALDIGCATGGAVFELSRSFEHVVGVDLSESFIRTAQALANGESLTYRYKVEGALYDQDTARIPIGANANRVKFRQADACSMPAEYLGFDVVLLANLLCRLPSPKSCLQRMMGSRGLVAPGGLLVLVSPYSWFEEHTQKSAWLGGFEVDGKPVRAQDTLKSMLSTEFELLANEDMPLLIREHARKYQYIVSNLMVWKKHP